jgi:hypothetical protein
MAENVVYPGGVDEVSITAGQQLTVRHAGDGYGRVIKKTAEPNTWSEVGRVSNSKETFYFSAAEEVQVESSVDEVFYTAGTDLDAPEFIPPSPSSGHVYFEDFDRFAAAEWTITTTEAGAGSATEALGDADGGVLVITNDAADADNDFLQKVGESFLFEAGKKLWFEVRCKISDVVDSTFVIGLQITDTTPFDVTDGVFFLKPDTDATVSLLVEKNNTPTTTVVGDLVNNTYVKLGYHYDGVSTIYAYLNRTLVGTSVVTNLPDDEVLTVSFGIQNGSAVANVLSIDYIMVAKER